MLAPHTERIGDAVLRALCIESLERYPAFVERLREATGFDAKLSLDGVVDAAFDAPQYDALCKRRDELHARGVACELLDRRETIALEPSVGKHVAGALVIADEGHVDNRRLVRALVAACEAAGVRIVSDAGDITVECDARRVLGVASNVGFAPARSVVNAAGAWSGSVRGIPAPALPRVTPVKGQMAALAIAQGFVRRPVWVPGAYLVPRADGRLLVGATVEDAGFDERVTARGIESLLRAALWAMPSLGGFALTETWAGLRPGTPDGLPRIGATALEGLYDATGHYRNGILLSTPLTARLVADAVEGVAGDRPRMVSA